MSDPKRPDRKRRTVASRPAQTGRAGGTGRGRPRRSPASRARTAHEPAAQPIRRSIAAALEQRSEQRLGFTARRAVILAVVVCVLTLTIAGPVRTFFAQRTDVKQQAAIEASLRGQIADLQQQKEKLADPAHIKAQARQRLGFVMPGEIPYQVQLPPTADVPGQPGAEPARPPSDDPWYTALWHTIADAPHGPPPPPAPPVPVTGG